MLVTEEAIETDAAAVVAAVAHVHPVAAAGVARVHPVARVLLGADLVLVLVHVR